MLGSKVVVVCGRMHRLWGALRVVRWGGPISTPLSSYNPPLAVLDDGFASWLNGSFQWPEAVPTPLRLWHPPPLPQLALQLTPPLPCRPLPPCLLVSITPFACRALLTRLLTVYPERRPSLEQAPPGGQGQG